MEMLGIATPASFKSLVLALILAILLGMWYCFWFTVRTSAEGIPKAPLGLTTAFSHISMWRLDQFPSVFAAIIHSRSKEITISLQVGPVR